MTDPMLQFILGDEGILPTRGSDGAGGLDLYAAERAIILPGQWRTIQLEIRSSFQKGWVALLRDRSGLARGHAIHVLAGVIDSDYRGAWSVVIINHGPTPFTVDYHSRIAQMVLVPCYMGTPVEAHEYKLGDTERGTAGFGSTGK